MNLLLYSYNHDKNNQWFCMLTDACCPIISPQKFRELFMKNYNKSIIKCKKAHWNVELHQRANLKYFSKDFHLVNDTWIKLCRYNVHLCILFMAGNNGMYEKINNGGLANESLFAIVLKIFNEFDKNKLINSSATICDWLRMSNPTSPDLFNKCSEQDEEIIKQLLKDNPYSLFLRKVNYQFPDEKLIELSYWDIKNNNNQLININKKIKKNILCFIVFLSFFVFLLSSFYSSFLQYVL